MKRLLQRTLIAFAAVALAAATPAFASDDPYLQPNNSWISLSGTVEEVSPNTFTLDYGDGIVTVEMDDGDRDADAYKLLAGDKVIVSGRIDDDLYERTKIEAASVYVENLGTTFFASSIDEEDAWFLLTHPLDLSETVIQGRVTEVNGEEFTVDTGLRKLTVEVEQMPYNPLDDEGYQKIEVGDRVRVRGQIDRDFFEGRALVAETVIELAS